MSLPRRPRQRQFECLAPLTPSRRCVRYGAEPGDSAHPTLLSQEQRLILRIWTPRRLEIAMTRQTRRGTFWPTPLQQQLLVAALADPPEAVAAWRALRPSLTFDELEPGSFELMPLVYRQLTAGGADDDLLSRLKGVYRKSWLVHNLLLERTKDTALALEEAGIRALFIEGAPLAVRYYPEPGLRYTSNVDVLVDDGALPAATAALAQASWFARPQMGAGFGGRHHLFDRDGHACVVRPSLAVDFVEPGDRAGSHAPLWEAAKRQEINGVPILVPQSTDALLGVCVSGARRLPVPSTQWIVDATMILRADDVDWGRLVQIAVATGQAVRLRDSLSYLSTLPAPRPPRDAIEQLAAVRSSRRARLAHRAASGSHRRLGALPTIVSEHLAATAHESPVRAVAAFPDHLRRRWNVAHGWQLPFAAGRRAIRIFRGHDGTA